MYMANSKSEARKEMLEEFSDSELNKQTLKNIFDWSCDGKDEKEIAKFLSLSKKEFNELKCRYPEIVGVMAKGTVYASAQLSLNMYELAMGGRTIYKDVLATETIYDDNGKKVRTIQKPVKISYQLEPNFYANKFLLENKERIVYGEEKRKEKENEAVNDLKNMDKKELYKLKSMFVNDDIEKIKGEKN